ncbi:MAG: glycerophosphodiester phosphodiesterase [Clostridia bacterium]|nr:glycerophosphodiester phosphodiesterase [Clostridia bacterium]
MEWIIVAVVLALMALYLYLVFPALRRHPDRVLMKGMYVAHRGLHSVEAGIPENSMRAYGVAKGLGFGIEIDIHLTADGEVVVFHDDTATRVCGKDIVIEKSTLAELKELRLQDSDEQIPTLKELLEFIDGEVPLLIEFKAKVNNCAALCVAADKILSQYKGKYIVQSFYPPVLRWYRRHRKDICRGQLATPDGKNSFEKWMAGCLLFNFMSRPDFISYDFQYTRNFGRSMCASLGAMSVGWTFCSEEELSSVKSFYSTYIFENFLPEKPYEDLK